MSLYSNLTMVNKKDLHRIHEQTIKILEKTGVAFYSKEALEVFKKAGAKIDGDIVYISGKMLENALWQTPKQFTWHAINPENSVIVGEDQERVHVMLDHGSVNIQDMENGRRESRMEDLINIYKLGQASRICNIIGQVPVDPSDADSNTKHLLITQQLLNHTDKPLMSYPVNNQKETNDIFSMVEMIMGDEYLNNNAAVGVSVCALSPLKFAPESCETILAYARKRQPVHILTCAMSGVTAPVSLMGTAIMQNAEILAGLVLTQLVSPGNPFIYCPASAVPNMRNAGYITGSPESNLINIVGLQLARELYGVPTRTMAGLTDAKMIDCQAGYETMQNLFTLMLSGTHLMNECMGTLDSIMTVSYEKFIIDEEMISRMMRIMKGVDTADEEFDISIIQEIGQAGSYLMHPSTAAKCRRMWSPEVSDWNAYAAWESSGAQDVMIRANQRYKDVLANSPDSLLDAKIDTALAAFIASKKYK
jgi:trimethylamine---corrinoid protein Co-methyltransferase